MRTTPGTSIHAPLSAERIDAARDRYGHAVDQYLDHLRLGDPLADALVECFEQLPDGRGDVLLAAAIEQGIDAVDAPPPPLVALFEHLDHVPFWVDWDRMRFASEKIIRNGLLTSVSFATCALPYCYLATFNKPLSFSAKLTESTAHRYASTARFVVECFMPDSLQRRADGFRFAVLVRYLHARARRMMLRSGDWVPHSYEIPINQSHMAMGIVFFSFYMLKGLGRLGLRFSRAEVESVLLTWRYVSHLSGIDPELVYTSEEEAQRLVDVAFSLEFDPDATSKRLYRSMIEAGPTFMKIENEHLGRLFVNVLYPLSRHLLGDDLADRLGAPRRKRRLLVYGVLSLIWISARFEWLLPQVVRDSLGVKFWLESSDYDLFTEDQPPSILS